MCKSVEIEQKGVKWVDASGMAVRVHAEKVVRSQCRGRCLWKVLGAKAADENLLLPGRGRKPRRKREKMPHSRGENGM